jgi:hypothetical protein
MNQQKDRTRNSYCYGISMPLDIIEKIDSIRQDLPRSRFILRMVKKGLEDKLQSGSELAGKSQTVAAHVAQTPCDNKEVAQHEH